MNLSVGIVGLPNVGKSTLFNALLKKQIAYVANYPFATIEPNVGVVPVPDSRLQKLAEITKEEEKMTALPPILPATVKFLDIAGLVKGANQGAGLGNKFLSHIREVSIIAHVVRVFEDENVIRYKDEREARLPAPERPPATTGIVGQGSDGGQGSTDSESDYDTIKTELILADLQTVQNAQSKVKRFQDLTGKSTVEKLFKGLNEGKPARGIALTDEEKVFAKTFFLLSDKQELVVLNISESDYTEENIQKITKDYSAILRIPEERLVVICAKVESDLSELSEAEQKEYLAGLGIKTSGLERLIQKAYQTLGLISFLTCGEKEVRAWTVNRGMKAVDAAGVIHTDFTKKFIKAEVVSYPDFVSLNGWKAAREKGKARLEGRDYVMQDGDVVEFKIGA